MEIPEDFHHDDLLDRAIDAVLHEPVPGGLPPERINELVAAVERAANQPTPITIIDRIKNMKPITKIVVAASVLLALLGAISWLVPGGGTGLAFADVAEALNNVHTATWKTISVVKMPDGKTVESSSIGMFLAPSHERIEHGSVVITIIDGSKDKVISLVPAAKTAMILSIKNPPPGHPFGRTFQGLRQIVVEAQSGKAVKTERLGVETIDGRRAEVFRLELGAIDVKLWADPKTSLPIRVEETTKPAAGPGVHLTMTDFQVGVPLDESLFSLDVPAGYTVQQTMQLDGSKKPLAYLAETLGWAAEHNGGVFPATLRGEQGIDGIAQRAAADLAKGAAKDPAAMLKSQGDLAAKMGGTFGVLFSLPPDSWHYAGKGVKLGTPNRPIFWVKAPAMGAKYQVIYADLSIKELPADEAAKVLPAEAAPKP